MPLKQIEMDGSAYETVIRRAQGKQNLPDEVDDPSDGDLPGLQSMERREGEPLFGIDPKEKREEFTGNLHAAISTLLSKELKPLEELILKDALERLKDVECAADLGYIANSAELASRRFRNHTP